MVRQAVLDRSVGNDSNPVYPNTKTINGDYEKFFSGKFVTLDDKGNFITRSMTPAERAREGYWLDSAGLNRLIEQYTIRGVTLTDVAKGNSNIGEKAWCIDNRPIVLQKMLETGTYSPEDINNTIKALKENDVKWGPVYERKDRALTHEQVQATINKLYEKKISTSKGVEGIINQLVSEDKQAPSVGNYRVNEELTLTGLAKGAYGKLGDKGYTIQARLEATNDLLKNLENYTANIQDISEAKKVWEKQLAEGHLKKKIEEGKISAELAYGVMTRLTAAETGISLEKADPLTLSISLSQIKENYLLEKRHEQLLNKFSKHFEGYLNPKFSLEENASMLSGLYEFLIHREAYELVPKIFKKKNQISILSDLVDFYSSGAEIPGVGLLSRKINLLEQFKSIENQPSSIEPSASAATQANLLSRVRGLFERYSQWKSELKENNPFWYYVVKSTETVSVAGIVLAVGNGVAVGGDNTGNNKDHGGALPACTLDQLLKSYSEGGVTPDISLFRDSHSPTAGMNIEKTIKATDDYNSGGLIKLKLGNRGYIVGTPPSPGMEPLETKTDKHYKPNPKGNFKPVGEAFKSAYDGVKGVVTSPFQAVGSFGKLFKGFSSKIELTQDTLTNRYIQLESEKRGLKAKKGRLDGTIAAYGTDKYGREQWKKDHKQNFVPGRPYQQLEGVNLQLASITAEQEKLQKKGVKVSDSELDSSVEKYNGLKKESEEETKRNFNEVSSEIGDIVQGANKAVTGIVRIAADVPVAAAATLAKVDGEKAVGYVDDRVNDVGDTAPGGGFNTKLGYNLLHSKEELKAQVKEHPVKTTLSLAWYVKSFKGLYNAFLSKTKEGIKGLLGGDQIGGGGVGKSQQ